MEMTKFYAQIDSNLMCIGVSQLSGAVQEEHMVELRSYDMSVLGKHYDRATGLWGSVTATPDKATARRVSVLGFRRRFTAVEKAAIEWAAVDRQDQPEAQRMQAAALRATLADQAAATFIDLDDNDTVKGVQALEAMGLLAAGRAESILGTPVQPEERP